MENKSRIHIIKRLDGWVIKANTNLRATKKFLTKSEAIAFAISIREDQDLVIHRQDGSIEKWVPANAQ